MTQQKEEITQPQTYYAENTKKKPTSYNCTIATATRLKILCAKGGYTLNNTHAFRHTKLFIELI